MSGGNLASKAGGGGGGSVSWKKKCIVELTMMFGELEEGKKEIK